MSHSGTCRTLTYAIESTPDIISYAAAGGNLVLILRGLPGSRRAAVASSIIEQCRAVNPRLNRANEVITCGVPTIEGGHPGLEARERASCMVSLISTISCSPSLIIIDGVHSRKWEYAAYIALAKMHEYVPVTVEVVCEDEEAARAMWPSSQRAHTLRTHLRMFTTWETDDDAVLVTGCTDSNQ